MVNMHGIKSLTKEEYSQLSPKNQERHISRIIREILQKHKNGITISQIHQLTGFSKTTIEKHLNELIAMNMCYKIAFGRTNAYYPNARTLHPLLEQNIPLGDKVYSVYSLENPNGRFIFIQEKKRDELNALIPSGGLLFKESFFVDFIKLLNKAKKSLEKLQKTRGGNDES